MKIYNDLDGKNYLTSEVKLKKEWIKENIQLRQIINRLMKDKENMIEELNSIHQRLKKK
jgi:hypothetical protein